MGATDVIRGQTLMSSQEERFETVVGTLPLIEQPVRVDLCQCETLVTKENVHVLMLVDEFKGGSRT